MTALDGDSDAAVRLGFRPWQFLKEPPGYNALPVHWIRYAAGLEAERDRLREALTEALTVLGTGDCKQPNCEGCDYERGEAVRILKEALDA